MVTHHLCHGPEAEKEKEKEKERYAGEHRGGRAEYLDRRGRAVSHALSVSAVGGKRPTALRQLQSRLQRFPGTFRQPGLHPKKCCSICA